MNRQMRRATEKSEKKREKERQERREARQAARRPAVKTADKAKDKENREAEASANAKRRTERVGRFSGWLTGMTAVFILVGAFTPTARTVPYERVVDVAYFVFLGYFLCLWLARRGVARAFLFAVVAGTGLGVLVEGIKWARPMAAPDLVLLALVIPGVLVGALLARLISKNA